MIKEFIENKLTDHQKEMLRLDSDVAQRFLSALDNALMNNQDSIGLPDTLPIGYG